jgi:hypothetical protein
MERRQFLQSTVLGAAATILGVTPPAAVATHLSFLQENIMSDPTRPYEPLIPTLTMSDRRLPNRGERWT